MAKISAVWSLVTSGDRLRRSSQAVSVIGNQVYVFGGELLPREPVDNQVDTIQLHGTSDSATATTIPAPAEAPSPRVGSPSTVLNGALYLFSGRGGIDMKPVEEQGALWRYTPSENRWDLIKPSAEASTYPAGRSYHCITSNGADTIYVHAGCPEKGRLSDLWSFNITSKTWTQLPDAPPPARGGPSIAYHDGKIYRMNGFDGSTEQGGAVDVFDCASGSWSTVAFTPDGASGPEARSVSALVAVDVRGKTHLVTIFGERDPSSLGHAGAGKMLGDVWAFDVAARTWSKVGTEGDCPAPRGWFDADAAGDTVCVHGGLAEDSSRLGDVWGLKFV
ncbi:kelch repeat protein [Colletotrichum sojae]|uniref:Kelch repeat protein n=1 Tax=Colletotrichum sojae TaxID=2175907 RepID=A0A8H6IQX3_9PEZI|nr:kelch repeat protein [Colletotrichum sojae]